MLSCTEHFPIVLGIQKVIWTQNARKIQFLSASRCWDARFSLREMDQEFEFGGIIGYGDSYMRFVICHSKIFRLHAILKDAAEAVRSHSSKGPGYCCMTGRGPGLCLFGHVTGLIFLLYVKLFLPSIFNTVDFWNSVSFFVLDVQLADNNNLM